MHGIDWIIVAAFLGLNIAIGIDFSPGGQNVDSFLVSGRSLKWYIAGASMIASDSPLWGGHPRPRVGPSLDLALLDAIIGCALGVALFSRLWRRTRVATDNELLELRYTGKGAQNVRQILFDWILVIATSCALQFMFSYALRNGVLEAGGMLVLFAALLFYVVHRSKKKLGKESE